MGNVPWDLFVLDFMRRSDSKSTLKQQEVFYMKTTGVIRKLDELGRITLPIELRRSLDLDKISAICGKVIKNGKMDINHGKYYYKKGIRICEASIPAEMYEKKEFEMGSFTYVGTIMNKKKLLEAGLPNKDYFIYWDDLEHGIRMRKAGKIIGVPGIVAYHDVGEEGSGINWKLYYSYRNMIDTYRKHFSGVCYDYFCLKIRVKIFLNHMTGHKKLELNILEEAFKNARQQKFGLHPVYRPGWKPGE